MRLSSPELLTNQMASTFTDNRRLANMAGVSRQFIWALAHGQETNASPETARAIENALGLEPGELFIAPAVSVPDPSHLLTATEVAAMLRVTPKKVRTWARVGKMAAVDVGDGRRSRWRFKPVDVNRFMQSRTAA